MVYIPSTLHCHLFAPPTTAPSFATTTSGLTIPYPPHSALDCGVIYMGSPHPLLPWDMTKQAGRHLYYCCIIAGLASFRLFGFVTVVTWALGLDGPCALRGAHAFPEHFLQLFPFSFGGGHLQPTTYFLHFCSGTGQGGRDSLARRR